MQIESFKVFRDLAETESFTKAAQINGVTQSAVSQQVSSMERQFRTMLIERSKKRFRLTREGELLYQTAKSMVQLYETFEAQMQELRDVVSGTLRVGTIYSLGLYNLPPYLRKFMRAHPGVHVHVAYMRSNTVYEEVAGNALDLGLVAYPVKDPQVDSCSSPRRPIRAPARCRWRSRRSTARSSSASSRTSRRGAPLTVPSPPRTSMCSMSWRWTTSRR